MIDENEKVIRFIDSRNTSLFSVPDGSNIVLTDSDGEKTTLPCKFIDEYHTQIGSSVYHIRQFAEMMERIGTAYAPENPVPLPAYCYGILPETGDLILIQQGENGYQKCYNSTPYPEQNSRTAERENRQTGVTPQQAAAMLGGALFGWDSPEAKTENYDLRGKFVGNQEKEAAVVEPLQTLRLYMPMTVSYSGQDESGEWMNNEIMLDSRDCAEYAPQIREALASEHHQLEQRLDDPGKADRGLMAYYDADDEVSHKVLDCRFTAEVRDGQLWGVAECSVQGGLTPPELDQLMEYITGQASDGFGKHFEQQTIQSGDMEISAHLWQGDGWSIMREQDRFDPQFSKRLPDFCLSVLPNKGTLICIQRGRDGYQLSNLDCGKTSLNRRLADSQNAKRGVSRLQEQAMLCGALFGWDCPQADPKFYEQAPKQAEKTKTNKRKSKGHDRT